MGNVRKSRLKILVSMFIFGTLSIVARGAGLPSAVLALGRAIIGSIALILYSALKGRRPELGAVRKNLKWLIPSGVMIGLNWVFLFEAYNYVSVATATLCYYMQPVFLVMVSPFVFKEKLTVKKVLCISVALLGMVLASGITKTGTAGTDLRGILLGLGAAVLYTTIMVFNKCMGELSPYDRVVTQLLSAIPALLVYILLTSQFAGLVFTSKSLVWLLIAGVIHTGLAYVLMYGSLPWVSSQTAAILSYLDPVVAIFVSVIFFKEKLTLAVGIGAILILGAAIVSETEPDTELQ